MSEAAMQWAERQYLGDPVAKNVLHALARRADDDWTCVVTVADLAIATELGQRTIWRSIEKLKAMHLVKARAHTGRRSTYWLDRSFNYAVPAYARAAAAGAAYARAAHTTTGTVASKDVPSRGYPAARRQNENHQSLSLGKDSDFESSSRHRESAPSLLPSAQVSNPIAAALAIFNEAAAEVGWPTALKLTPARKAGLFQCLKECEGLAGWRKVIDTAKASPFLRGDRGNGPGHEGWRFNLDWLLRPDRFQRVREGVYSSRETRAWTVEDYQRAIDGKRGDP